MIRRGGDAAASGAREGEADEELSAVRGGGADGHWHHACGLGFLSKPPRVSRSWLLRVGN